MSSNAQSIVRFNSPAEIAALVPLLVGFIPTESVVVISLRGDRKRVGLTMRVDLPAAEHLTLLAEQLAARLTKDGALAAVVAVYTDEPDADGERAGQALVDAIGSASGVAITEALLVRGGRWWSYFCAGRCCPLEGTPLDDDPTPALQLVAAQSVAQGRAVLASREDLVRSVAPPQLLAATAALQHLDAAADDELATRAELTDEARRQAAVEQAQDLLEVVASGGTVDGGAAAAFAISVHDVPVRDEIATWALDRPDELLALLQQVARQIVSPYDAPVCTLLAWVAYAGGDGGLANVALDRALESDDGYSMALLLRTALDGQVPPAEVRKILRGTRTSLRAASPPARRSRRRRR